MAGRESDRHEFDLYPHQPREDSQKWDDSQKCTTQESGLVSSTNPFGSMRE